MARGKAPSAQWGRGWDPTEGQLAPDPHLGLSFSSHGASKHKQRFGTIFPSSPILDA